MLPYFKELKDISNRKFTIVLEVGVPQIRGTAEVTAELIETHTPKLAVYKVKGRHALGMMDSDNDVLHCRDAVRIFGDMENRKRREWYARSLAQGILIPLAKRQIKSLVKSVHVALGPTEAAPRRNLEYTWTWGDLAARSVRQDQTAGRRGGKAAMNPQPFHRKEDNRLVRGRGRFVDDEGGRALHLKFVRSPYAHARILKVDVSAAEALEGVICTLTGAEVAKLTSRFMQIAPAPADRVVDYCMASDRVRFQGEPVAAVVAISPTIAADATELVRVDYEPLPVIVDAVEALKNKSLLHEQVGTNQSWGSVFDWGDVNRAFAEADTVIEIDRLKFHRFSSTPLEGYAAIVTWEAGGRIDMLCNLIQPGIAMKFMAPALGVSPEQLRVRTQDIGGGFGIKQNLYPYLIAAALASTKAGHRPIKWVEDRREHLQASAHGNERTFLDIRVALKANGEMTAISAKHVDDCGAYPRYEPLGGVIWSQVAPASYRLQNLRIDFQQAMTNKCPVGPNRGFSRMQHVWFLERVIDICAHEMGIAADEMRRRNYVPEMPWTTPNGCIYDLGDYAAMLDAAKALIGWDEWIAKRDSMRAQGRNVGIGIGTALDFRNE